MAVGECEVCGGPVRSQYGVCLKTEDCRRERFHRSDVARNIRERKITAPCRLCGKPTRSKYGICATPGPCLQAYQTAAFRVSIKRTDRPCRARHGCSRTARADSRFCLEHHREWDRRRQARRRRQLVKRLAERQGWVCPWCLKKIKADLRQASIDHIIPKNSGLVIEEDWNLQALHRTCNREKSDQVTSQAVVLAAEHGLLLAV